MTHIFYLMLFIFIIYEILVFGDADRIVKKQKEYKSLPKDDKLEYLSKNSSLVAYSAFNVFYLLYVFVGLFTSQWFLFLLISGMGFIPKNTVIKKKIDAVITIIVLIFILINKYHLHINIF